MRQRSYGRDTGLTLRIVFTMMMLAMVVGVALIVGAAIKKFMPGLFGQIQGMISNAAGSLGAG